MSERPVIHDPWQRLPNTSGDVYELLKHANESRRDDVAIGYLIRAIEALAVIVEDISSEELDRD